MPYDDRKTLMQAIEELRGERTLVSLCNFDRVCFPEMPGLLSTMFQADLKECLYRILKESPTDKGIDLFLYTRGGDTNSVWPIVSLLREFDADFHVIVPFRAHSAGTLLALAAKKIHMTRLAELSPIDPTTGNPFNPQDPVNPKSRLGIAVEDVRAYQSFILETLGTTKTLPEERKSILEPFLKELVDKVHPLALGNVHRVYQQISRLAEKFLALHSEEEDLKAIVIKLTVESFSHLHMIDRQEAIDILTPARVEATTDELETAADALLKRYEDDFNLRRTFCQSRLMGPQKTEKKFNFVGAAVESRHWGYLFRTEGTATQHSVLPTGVNLQIPPGQNMPLITGLPRELQLEIHEQGWRRNTEPKGVTT